MLLELDIQNFAIIKNLKIKFTNQMTVLIGETGAGKSILIDALSLLLGHRAQSEMIRTGENKAVITGLFTISSQQTEIVNLAAQYGLPLDGDDLIISREINISGRNVIRINGQLTTITVLSQIGKYLVDIHGQNSQQMLMDESRHIELIDEYAKPEIADILSDYKQQYQTWKQLKSRLQTLQKSSQELAQKQDILQFQDNELTAAHLSDPEEDMQLENEFSRLDNFQKIAETANYLEQLFDDDEHGLSSLLAQAQAAGDDLASLDTEFNNFNQALADGSYALNDARSELSHVIDGLDFDQERFQEVTARLDLLNQLKKKYGPSLQDVLNFHLTVKEELAKFEDGGFDEEQLQKQIAQLEKHLTALAEKLHAIRETTALKLERAIKQELGDLYMEKARFNVHFETSPVYTSQGTDLIAFYIAPNPGEALLPLVKIVSGGEQSRLILALKTIFSKVEPVGTMIFDEIDTGVSGRVSAAIGKKMQSIAQTKQVIAITHSPQVAASADHCLKINKSADQSETFTTVQVLTGEARVEAIAQMMAGENLTTAAKNNARDLIDAQQKKS